MTLLTESPLYQGTYNHYHNQVTHARRPGNKDVATTWTSLFLSVDFDSVPADRCGGLAGLSVTNDEYCSAIETHVFLSFGVCWHRFSRCFVGVSSYHPVANDRYCIRTPNPCNFSPELWISISSGLWGLIYIGIDKIRFRQRQKLPSGRICQLPTRQQPGSLEAILWKSNSTIA